MPRLGDFSLDLSTPKSSLASGQVTFSHPPGASRARWFHPVFDREQTRSELLDDLADRVKSAEIEGVFSGAHSGEAYLIALFILGGIGGGALAAIGEDIWTALRKAIAKVMKRHGSPHNLVEVVLEFNDFDVVFHVESKEHKSVPEMFDDADRALGRLAEVLADPTKIPGDLKTVEIRASAESDRTETVYYSSRRGRDMRAAAAAKTKQVGDSSPDLWIPG